MIVKLLDGPVN